MNQNILTRQMQEQYVQHQKTKARGEEMKGKVHAFIPSALMFLAALGIPIGSLIAGVVFAGFKWDFGAAIIALIPAIFVGMGLIALGCDLMDSFFEKRTKKAKSVIEGASQERDSWWEQVDELLDKSERGKLKGRKYGEDPWIPVRSWVLPDKTTRKLRAVTKNGAVWLVDDDNGDVLVRTYGDRGMTTVVTDEGELVAVSASAAALMGEHQTHPTVQ